MTHILVAEDESSLTELITLTLKNKGFTVTAVANGALAYEALAVENPPFDLVLADINMPVMDGIALALAIKSIHPNLPFLLMTGYIAERNRAYELKGLLEGVLSKPFTTGELEREVNRVLKGLPQPSSPSI